MKHLPRLIICLATEQSSTHLKESKLYQLCSLTNNAVELEVSSRKTIGRSTIHGTLMAHF